MNLRSTVRLTGLALMLAPAVLPASAEDVTNAIQAFLQHRVEVEQRDTGVVVGLVDEQGPRVVSCGRPDSGTRQPIDGDTLFEVGSITKTFTALLLQDMVERGEMRLDDPVANYLPASVRVPTRHGKPITLLHLATHTSGLPLLAYNLDPRRADDPYADYTVEKLYAFLSGYQLTSDPGSKYEYSELGMELLGHVIARKAGTNYETLLVERICRPLGMDSTRIALTPELKARLARGHDPLGHAFPGLHFQSLVGGSGLHSTANDLLKYVSANLGLTSCPLTPLMEKMHRVRFESITKGVRMGLGWAVLRFPQGTEFVVHGGATPGFTAFIGLDHAGRRGVVVLAPADDHLDLCYLGLYLLRSEWRPDQRPAAVKVEHLHPEAYVGEYRLRPNASAGILALRLGLAQLLSKTFVGIVAVAGLAGVLLWLLLKRIPLVRRLRSSVSRRWRALSLRARWVARGGAVVLVAGAVVATPLVAAQVLWAWTQAVVDIRREDDRLFVQCTGMAHTSSRVTLPRVTGELLPESGTRFFERMSGMPITFATDARGEVTRLRAELFGTGVTFVKSAHPAPDPPKPPAAVSLAPKLCDACVGQYEFAPDDLFPDGVNLTLRREGDRLSGRAADKNASYGTFEVYPLSETNFFFTLTVVGVELNFVKNDRGEVTSVIRHVGWLPDRAGKKLGEAGN